PAGTTVIPGNLTIGTGILGTTAALRHQASFLVVGNILINRGGLWDLNGQTEGFSNPDHPLVFNNGGAVQTGTGTLFLPPGNSITYNASVINPGGASIS